MKKIKTERLVLKSFEEKDIQLMVELLKNKEIKKTYMIPSFDNEEQYFKLASRFLEFSLNDEHYVVGIYLDNLLIGFINDVEIKGKSIELGYVVNPKFKNNGYATEALKGSINYLFENGYEEIICGAFSSNEASIKVMEKAGLILLNRMDTIQYHGVNHSCIYYSIFKGMNN